MASTPLTRDSLNTGIGHADRASLFLLLLFWLAAIRIVDPVGDFMVNDDWHYFRCLQALVEEGRIEKTGWASVGGPSLISHLVWGGLFSSAFGLSPTTLRWATLVMGMSGSFVLFFLCRLVGARAWLAFGCTITLVTNPLFFSQSFTYMTDITFTAFLAFSLFWLHRGIQTASTARVAGGLLLAAATTLTRQFGLLLVVGFMLSLAVQRPVIERGRRRLVLLCVLLVVLPWLGWELVLHLVGSTPVTDHQLFGQTVDTLAHSSGLAYAGLVLSRFCFILLPHTALWLSPVLVLTSQLHLQAGWMRKGAICYVIFFLLLMAALLAEMVALPVWFHRNVINDYGIGPLLLKDVYILGTNREILVTPLWFYSAVFVALPSLLLLGFRFAGFAGALLRGRQVPFAAAVSFFGAMAYAGVICLTGFHDRYLIPLLLLTIVWLAADSRPQRPPVTRRRFAAAVAILLAVGGFALGGTHDFMAAKRAQAKAHGMLVEDLAVDPCRVDGGFEFNGYHCSRGMRHPPPSGLSWWWVAEEAYLVTMGPLAGYREVASFPFDRLLGRDGAIRVLASAAERTPGKTDGQP